MAVVTAEPRLRMNWRQDTVVDISRAFLDTNGVTQTARAAIAAPDPAADYRTAIPAGLAVIPLADAFQENLQRLEVACQKGLAERFDASIGAATVGMPFAGRYQLTARRGHGGQAAGAPWGNRHRHGHDVRRHPRHLPVEPLPRRGLRGGAVPGHAWRPWAPTRCPPG